MTTKRAMRFLGVGLVCVLTWTLIQGSSSAPSPHSEVHALTAAFVSPLKPEVVHLQADGSGDYPSLQAALETVHAGSIVYLGPGTYRCEDRPFEINRSLALIGAGMGQTRVVCGGYNTYVLRFGGESLYTSAITFAREGGNSGSVVEVLSGESQFSDCRFTGGVGSWASNVAGSGLYVGGSARAEVAECEAIGNVHGYTYGESSSGVVRDSRSMGNASGLLVVGQARPVAERNTFVRNYWGGRIVQSEGAVIRNCDCSQNEGYGIEIDQGAAPVLEGNTCTGNGEGGIHFANDAGGTARGNTCSDNGKFGILVSRFSDSTYPPATGLALRPVLEDNVCTGNGEAGIAYAAEGDCAGQARHNRCTGNGREGISVGGECRPLLEGNILEDNASAGLAFHDSAGGESTGNTCAGGSQGIYVSVGADPLLAENDCPLYVQPVPTPTPAPTPTPVVEVFNSEFAAGTEVLLGPQNILRGSAWSPEGGILAAPCYDAPRIGGLCLYRGPDLAAYAHIPAFVVDPPVWSPDGERVAFVDVRGPQDPDSGAELVVVGVDGTEMARLLSDRLPAWSDPVEPARVSGWLDEDTVVVEGSLDSDPRGQRCLYALDVNTGVVRLLAGGPDAEIAHVWGGRHFLSPDKMLLILERPEDKPGLLVVDRESGVETPLPIDPGVTEQRFQDWAPDGRSFLYLEWQREYGEPQGAFPPPTKNGEEPPERTRLRTSRPMLYLWDHDEGSPRLLAANALGAAVSPNGESVAFMLLGDPELGPEGELVGTHFDPGQPFELYLVILDLNRDRLVALVPVGHVAFDWDPLTTRTAPMAVDRLGADSYRPAWSPDGEVLLYLDSRQDLWACSADGQTRARVTTGGWGVDGAAWSADGAHVALTTSVGGIQHDPLWVIRRPALPQVTGPSPTGRPVVTARPRPEAEVVPTPAATVRVAEITELPTPHDDCYPLLSPSGSRYLCYRRGEDEQPELWLASREGGFIRRVIEAEQMTFHWVDDGSIVYATRPRPETGPLVPVTFLDLDTGESTALGRTYDVAGIQAHPSGYIAFLSDQGLHVASPKLGISTVVPIRVGPEAQCGLYAGAAPQPTPTPRPWSEIYGSVGVLFDLSPDGSRLATLRLREECAVLSILDVATGTETVISDSLSYESSGYAPQAPLAWSSDGTTLAYSLYRSDTWMWEIWLVNADGSGARPLWAPGEWKRRYDHLTWLGEGPYLAFVEVPGGTDGTSHAALRAIGSRGGQPVTLLEEIHERVQISPDGRRVVYTVGSFQTPVTNWRNYLARLEW